MDRTTFGRTGLQVSVLGLGGGGYSRLGTAQGASEEEAARVVRRAVDLGVNLFDSAEGYGTEPVFARGLKGVPREEVVLCTKAGIWNRDAAGFADNIDRSLKNLGTDYIDLYQFHGVSAEAYPRVVETYLPVLERARGQGKVRFIGLTEAFEKDPGHEMLSMAIREPAWDSMMVGCNILNFSAEERLFPVTKKNGVGTLGMFAVRFALAGPENLKAALDDMIAHGQLEASPADALRLGERLLEECDSLPEAAYRFCRHLPGMDCVLSGTGSPHHLVANVRAVSRPPLSEAAQAMIREVFGSVDSVSGKTPSGEW